MIYSWKRFKKSICVEKVLKQTLVAFFCLTFSKIYLTIEYEKSFNILTVVFLRLWIEGFHQSYKFRRGDDVLSLEMWQFHSKILSSSFCLRGCKANKTPKSFLSSARLWWFFSNKRRTFAVENLNLAFNAKSWKLLQTLTFCQANIVRLCNVFKICKFY